MFQVVILAMIFLVETVARDRMSDDSHASERVIVRPLEKIFFWVRVRDETGSMACELRSKI